MGYEYGFEEMFPEIMEEAAGGMAMGAMGVVTGILLLLWFLAMGFAVVMYVFNAVGMYRIAKRRGIHHAWLAWVPIGCNWLLGSISDHYQYVAKQKVTKRRRILLILSLVQVVVSTLFMVGAFALSFAAGPGMNDAIGSVLLIALMVVSYLGMLGVMIAILVFCYIAYYDLFRSCKPKQDVLFLVLGILVNVTLPFFVFACGNSDEGMPARRKPQPAPEILCEEEAPAPYAEPQPEEIPVVEGEIVEDPE